MFSKTSVRLTWETGYTPSSRNTFVSTTLGYTQHINVLVLAENGIYGNLLLEQTFREIDLSSYITSVDLDFHNMCLLQSEIKFLNLCMCNNTNNRAKFLDSFQLGINVLTTVFSVFLGAVPVLVHATFEFFIQMLGKDRGKCSKAHRRFNVPDNTNNDHRWSFNDGNSINDLALVHQRTRTVHTTDDVCHTGFVPTEGS